MKWFWALLFSAALQGKETLTIKDKTIQVISSFDSTDYFSTFAIDGTFLWEIPFRTEIVSYKENESCLFFLSKERNGSTFFLSCFETAQGAFLWEKPIFAPKTTE